jgi:hypothetical protein
MKSKSKAKSTTRKMSPDATIPMQMPIGGCGSDIMDQIPEDSFEDFEEPPIGTTESSAFARDQVDIRHGVHGHCCFLQKRRRS